MEENCRQRDSKQLVVPSIMAISPVYKPSSCSTQNECPITSLRLFLQDQNQFSRWPLVIIYLSFYSVLLIQNVQLLHMWGPSNISKICFRETQEFPRFLSPPIAGSSSAFLESEHLYSFYSWFPPLQLSPYLTPATTVKACLPLPPPPASSFSSTPCQRPLTPWHIVVSYLYQLLLSVADFPPVSWGDRVLAGIQSLLNCVPLAVPHRERKG